MNIFSSGKKKPEITHKQFIMTPLYAPPPHGRTLCTWRKQADGHQQHMFLLLQVQLLQAHLELHQRLQQLQSVARCRGHIVTVWAAHTGEYQLHTISEKKGPTRERYHPTSSLIFHFACWKHLWWGLFSMHAACSSQRTGWEFLIISKFEFIIAFWGGGGLCKSINEKPNKYWVLLIIPQFMAGAVYWTSTVPVAEYVSTRCFFS